MSKYPKALRDLYTLFSSIDTPAEARDLLEDILTPQELESISERWQEIQMLAAGKTHRDVAKKLAISISKVTRGARMLQYGSGGFIHFLKKLEKPIHSRFNDIPRGKPARYLRSHHMNRDCCSGSSRCSCL